jgi:hypothetical protein
LKKKKIEFSRDINGCFVITSHQSNGDGYCYMRDNHKQIRIHRHVYEECFGEIPEGLVVRHKCDVRNCINPEHMELGTPKDNTHDTISRGRKALGEKSNTNRITESEAREIKIMLKNGRRNCEISRSLGVPYQIISRIRQNVNWKHVAI